MKITKLNFTKELTICMPEYTDTDLLFKLDPGRWRVQIRLSYS